MEKEFSSSKEFTKEKRLDERKQAAETIRAKRREYFSAKEKFQIQLEKLLADAEAKKIQAADVRLSIEQAEAKIEKNSRNFIKKFLERREIKQLQTELGSAKISEETVAEELAQLEAAQFEAQQSLQDQTLLNDARKELADFYQQAEQDWNNYEDDREAGNVKNVMREKKVFMVHAFISPAYSPSDENGVIRKELGWRTKLDLLSLEPTLSASAVDKDHTKTFAPVGVLLNEGQVQRASSQDLGSKSAGLNERVISRSMNQSRIRAQLDEALEPGRSQGWNEFVVSNPKVSGLFFKLNKDNQPDNLTFGSDTTVADVAQVAKERGLPLFALKDGEFYKVSPEEALALNKPKEEKITEKVGLSIYHKTVYDYPKLELKNDQLLTPEEAAELAVDDNKNRRELTIERLMTDSPFQLKRFPEATQVASRAEGRVLYHLYSENDANKKEGTKAIIPKGAAGNVDPLEVRILETIPGPTHLEHFVELDDGSKAVWRESRNPISPGSKFIAGSRYQQDYLIGTERASRSIAGIQIFDKSKVGDAGLKSIVNDVKAKIEYFTQFSELLKKDGNINYSETNKNTAMDLASALYGLAEEAEKAGDIEIANLAKSTTAEVYPLNQYQDMLARRVSESGTFKITREELLKG